MLDFFLMKKKPKLKKKGERCLINGDLQQWPLTYNENDFFTESKAII